MSRQTRVCSSLVFLALCIIGLPPSSVVMAVIIPLLVLAIIVMAIVLTKSKRGNRWYHSVKKLYKGSQQPPQSQGEAGDAVPDNVTCK